MANMLPSLSVAGSRLSWQMSCFQGLSEEEVNPKFFSQDRILYTGLPLPVEVPGFLCCIDTHGILSSMLAKQTLQVKKQEVHDIFLQFERFHVFTDS